VERAAVLAWGKSQFLAYAGRAAVREDVILELIPEVP
jgi:hypothetical protein